MLRFFRDLKPCLIGIEAGSSAHYWARELQQLGHTVKLIAPQFVKPYVKGNNNDANDAEAILKRSLVPTCVMWLSKRLPSKIYKRRTGYEAHWCNKENRWADGGNGIE